MKDVPIVFGLAVIVDRASGDVVRIFSTVDAEEEIGESLKESERLLGIFPMCLKIGEMEKFMARTPVAKQWNLLVAKFFSFGYRIGQEEGKKELREAALPHLDELAQNLEMVQDLEVKINEALASLKKPE